MDDTDLKQISRILLRSFIVAMVVLLLWMVVYLALEDYWYLSHTKLFNITEHELSLINYAGMWFYKILILFFLVCPFVAIQTLIRFKKGN